MIEVIKEKKAIYSFVDYKMALLVCKTITQNTELNATLRRGTRNHDSGQQLFVVSTDHDIADLNKGKTFRVHRWYDKDRGGEARSEPTVTVNTLEEANELCRDYVGVNNHVSITMYYTSHVDGLVYDLTGDNDHKKRSSVRIW